MARFHQYDNNSFILPKEVVKIIHAVPKVSKHPERDSLIIETGWETGGRVSEVLGLVPEHVLEQEIVLVNLKQRHAADRAPPTKIIEVSPELCNWLKRYCEQQSIEPKHWIFHAVNDPAHMLDRRQVWEMVTAASEAAGVYRLGKAHPKTGGRYKGIGYHVLRHSYAVYLLKKTKNLKVVQKQLGHANIQSTQLYADVAFEDVRAEVANAGVHLYHP